MKKIFLALLLTSCASTEFQPIETISKIDLQKGYRLEKQINEADDTFVVLMFSGGGTRAAAFGYAVLEQLHKQPFKKSRFSDTIDLVQGVSGGSILAAYFSLYGHETIPHFEYQFLNRNFQKHLTSNLFSLVNFPRLMSKEYGRGDLLQEELDNYLFKNQTFADLDVRRKGPFAVISTTDMASGSRLEFTQEYFDAMCLNLSDLKISRAVAASSAVPLLFSPLTLNNNGGNCNYQMPKKIKHAIKLEKENKLQKQTKEEITKTFSQYENKERPYIHLLDGGLTDNLGLRNLLDITEIYSKNMLYELMKSNKIKRIVIINVNAQNQIASNIDKRSDIPSYSEVISAIINIPIDKYSQESLRRFRTFTDEWNSKNNNPVKMYFISLNLLDLPPSSLRNTVLNIETSFYLPKYKIHALKEAARILLKYSLEYQRLLNDLAIEMKE